MSESFTKSSITDEINREITVPTSLTTILTLGALAASGLATLNGLVIWNTHATNFVTLGFIDTSAKAAYFKLPAGRPFVLFSDQLETNVTGGAFSAFNSIDTINAIADTAACVLKIRAF